MKNTRRNKQLLWLLAGWLFIAPLLGFQHLYGGHSNIADDVCELCVLSSGGGHAVAANIFIPAFVAPLSAKLSMAMLPASQAMLLRAKARAPPYA
jgi:hypothetical protein